jgi:hypothetical protein
MSTGGLSVRVASAVESGLLVGDHVEITLTDRSGQPRLRGTVRSVRRSGSHTRFAIELEESSSLGELERRESLMDEVFASR